MRKQPLELLVAQASVFKIHLLPQTQSIRPHLVPYPSLCSSCVNYGMICHAIGDQVLSTQPLSR